MIHSYSELSRENEGEGDVFFPGESDGQLSQGALNCKRAELVF